MPQPADCSAQRKIAVINRRFWPISGAAEQEVSNLCSELVASNHRVDVLTVRWQKHWPAEFRYQECDVFRLPRPSSGPFGTFRYLKSLTAQLAAQPNSQPYDAVIIFGLGDETVTAAAATGDACQLLLRITQIHLLNIDIFSSRQCDALKAAHSILADTPETADFIGRHLPTVADRIRVVPAIASTTDGLPKSQTRQESSKAAARVALSDAHPILQIDAGNPLVITSAPMESDQGVCDLVRAWKQVQAKHVTGRLWILGEGELSPKVWQEIVDLDLVYTAIMPGFFDNISLVLEAADLYIHPLRSPSSCCVLEMAKMAGLCTIETASLEEIKSAALTQSSRPFVDCPDRGLLVPRETPTALAATINYAIEHAEFTTQFAQEVQRRVLNHTANSPHIGDDIFKTPTPVASKTT